MIPIVLLSDRPQNALLSRLAFALERNIDDSFVLREHIGKGELALERGILVIKDLRSAARKVKFGKGVVAVIESSCRSAVHLMGKHGMSAVCCGMSPRDTLIAESLDNGRGILSLQRSIPTVYGEREPCQLAALTDSCCDLSSLLLTAGVLLALGIDEEMEIRM